jgi:hypothetical protein
MFRCVDGAGLGNLFIWLSQIDEKTPVSSKIYDGFRGKYLDFMNLNIVEDDPNLESIPVPDIYLNTYTRTHVHPNIVNKVKPSKVLEEVISDNLHLIKDVECAIAIRTFDKYAGTIADEETLETFERIIKNATKKVFVACDSLAYKLTLDKKYPGKVNFLREETVHINNYTKIDSSTPFLEFFLLSLCPLMYLTGGPPDMTKFSTFGYMASVYGNVDVYPIFNGRSQLQLQ